MFNYFTDTIVLIFLGYSVVYPFYLWITPLRQIDGSFYRFNLGLCCVIGALGAIGYHALNPDLISEVYVWIWLALLLSITAFYWHSKRINNLIISSVSIFGSVIMSNVLFNIVPALNQEGAFFATLLGAMITAGVFFAMILGHWYLNVVNLPIRMLKKAVIILSALLIVRSFWDVVYMTKDNIVDSYGINHSLWSFTLQFEGFLLVTAFFMGNIVPIVLNYFIWRTLKLQATQSATGLLYVSVISILFGELLFKYYLLQFGFLV